MRDSTTRLIGYERQLTEWNLAFLASVSRILLRMENADELMWKVAAKIGAYLNVSRCAFVEINEAADKVMVTHDWQRKAGRGLRGVYRLSDFVTKEFQEAARTGEPLIIRDLATATEPPADPKELTALKIASLVCMPILPDGRLRFALCVCHSLPYDWREDEIALVRELAGRIWIRLERVRVQEALRESESRYRSLFNSIDEGFCVVEVVLDEAGKPADYRFLEMNPSFEKQSDLRDAVGKRVCELAPNHEKHWFETLGKVAVTGEPVRFCNEAPHLPGRWFDVYAFRVFGPDSRKVAILSTDITDRRKLEVSLIERANELARADRSKDEFLAMLAHELRNPLAPLRNAAEILKGESTSGDERQQAQGILDRQIKNMSRMIDDLLDVSRITQGKIQLRREPVSLQALLTTAASVMGAPCAEHRQKLELAMPGEPVFLYADATRLEQVLNNLLVNACKYSGHGSHIWLSAELEQAGEGSPASFESTDAGAKGREVVIRVRDDGAGIAPNLLPRVFDLFMQASRTLDRAYSGLGIGLTLVQRLVRLHGGSVEARSEGLGCGAEFTVRLPVLDEVPALGDSPQRVATENPRRILIVDDNRDSALSLAMLLRRRGHVTEAAFTGSDAIAVAAEFLPEVVLLDIGLPGMDGFDVARRMRRTPALSNGFLVAMSGYASDEFRKRAQEVGFDEYLIKPLDLEHLSASLESSHIRQ